MRVRALVVRILRQFFRDKRTLVLMFVAPLLILWMFSLIFNGQTYEPKLGAWQIPEPIMQSLQDNGATIQAYSSIETMEDALEHRTIDAMIYFEQGKVHIKLEGSDPSINQSVLLLLNDTFQAQHAGELPQMTYLHGSAEMSTFDNIGPVLVGYFSFFFVFLIAGVSFLRERTGGTLERLLATPLRRGEIVLGYVLGFGIFTMVQAGLVAWFAIDLLDMMMEGSFGFVLLITLLLAMTALTLGTLLSSFANNELQMIQFIPLVILPQIFFSGLFNMETMVVWLRGLGTIMPLTYGANALRAIMIRGQGWTHIAQDVYILIGFTLLFMGLNVLALKKHRKL